MPRTKKKPEQQAVAVPPTAMNGPTSEVFTLAEAAAYLRLPEAEIVRLVEAHHLPGRFTGSEWRFLKSAIQDWLRTGTVPKSTKEAWMALAGAWKDDPYLEEMLKEIHKQRGRPVTENE
jgi:excisionase family DNA binding protein